MVDYRLKDYAKKLKSTHLTGITCGSEDCPQFKNCPQIPGQGQFFGKKTARIFFVFECPGQDDSTYGIPAISPPGSYFRE